VIGNIRRITFKIREEVCEAEVTEDVADAAILFVEGDVDYLIGSIIVRDHLLNYT
jgi:hypothetical protein